MRRQGLAWWRPLVIASCLTVATCTNCYYPNGDLSPSNNDQPCSTQKGASCCPLNWQCLDNGLCYYPPDNYYGRYGCTDQSWKSPYCPSGLCTNGLIAAGDEAIVQCSNKDNKWCCDGDRIHVKCCSNDSLTYFDLPDGNVFATIGSGSTPTTAPVVNTFDSDPSSTAKSSAAKSSAAHSSAAPPSVTVAASSTAQSTSAAHDSTSLPTSAAAYTTIRTSLTTGSSGAIATVYITSAITPTATPTPGPHPSHTDLIVGCAVGIPLGLGLLGLLAFLLRRRRNSPPSDPNDPNDAVYAGTFKAPHRAQAQLPPELGGEPIGAGRPISVLKGRAELEGTPRSVAASSSSSPPPGYSGGAAGAGAGQESTPGGRYISYRPPMEGVQERAELTGG
ncbi:hypothetical protein V2W45_1472234 [Cenococcum geophilum]